MEDNKIEQEGIEPPKYREEETHDDPAPVKLSAEELLAKMIEEDIKKVEENKKNQSATISTDSELNILRSQRNQLLISSDWTQLPDVPEAIQSAWKDYRQQLRDITTDFTNLSSVTWPQPPSNSI